MADNEQTRYMIFCEKRLARLWVQDDGESVEEVARSLRRNRSSIWDLLADELDERVGIGRKKALDESGKDRLVALTDRTVKKADVRWLESAEMIQQKFTPKVSVRTLRARAWRLVAQDANRQQNCWRSNQEIYVYRSEFPSA